MGSELYTLLCEKWSTVQIGFRILNSKVGISWKNLSIDDYNDFNCISVLPTDSIVMSRFHFNVKCFLFLSIKFKQLRIKFYSSNHVLTCSRGFYQTSVFDVTFIRNLSVPYESYDMILMVEFSALSFKRLIQVIDKCTSNRNRITMKKYIIRSFGPHWNHNIELNIYQF